MKLTDFLEGTGPVLFDGANGSLYQEFGIRPGTSPELLNLENRDLVQKVHDGYVGAGSMVIETNTFGANRKRLQVAGLDGKIKEIIAGAAEIALTAAGGRALVVGSVGPLGEFVEPYGEVSAREAADVFSEQVSLMLRAGIQFIQIETMMSVEEAVLALKAAHDAGAKHVGVTMTFEPTPDGPKSPFGESPSDAARVLLENGAFLVGSNCGKGLDVMRDIARELFKSAPASKILLQPNAGIPATVAGKVVYPESPHRFAEFVDDVLTKGVRFVGGCCGTTPAHLAQARAVLNSRSRLRPSA